MSFHYVRASFKVISISLDKNSIIGPSSFSLISEGPNLKNSFSRFNLVLFSKVFLHKPSIIYDFLLNIFPWVLLLLLRFFDFIFGFLVLSPTVSAEYANWSMRRISNFKKWMLMSFIGLTLITEIEVFANTTFIPDSLDRVHVARVTDKTFMDNLSLLSCFLAEIVNHQSLEGLSSVVLDFLTKDLSHFNKELRVKNSASIASSTGESFLVNFVSIASEAN